MPLQSMQRFVDVLNFHIGLARLESI